MEKELYYTVQEVQELLGCEDETVLAWIHSGQLLAVNISKSLNPRRPTWRIAKSALNRHLQARQNSQEQTPAPKATKRKAPKQYI
jgi:excisionase family DNA binding protein